MKEVPEKPPSKSKGVACPKCEHVNEAEKHTCRRCGSHLYVSCKKCGVRNPRVRSSCSECGQRLHRSAWSKLDNKISRLTKGKVKAMHILFLVAGIWMAYKVIVMLAEYQPPAPQ